VVARINPRHGAGNPRTRLINVAAELFAFVFEQRYGSERAFNRAYIAVLGRDHPPGARHTDRGHRIRLRSRDGTASGPAVPMPQVFITFAAVVAAFGRGDR
jgi:hypothetical protein